MTVAVYGTDRADLRAIDLASIGERDRDEFMSKLMPGVNAGLASLWMFATADEACAFAPGVEVAKGATNED